MDREFPQDVDYTTVTEMTGQNVTSEQVERMYARYRFAADFCGGKRVLEVACGSGQGLGYLARKAAKVVGGDYDKKLVDIANTYYKGRVEVRQLDAHNLPFENESFDVVLLYEAIYYLSQPERFVEEARRVLSGNGVLIICNANKDWSDFNPSSHSYRYFSAPELNDLLLKRGFHEVKVYGHCPAVAAGLPARLLSMLKRTAVACHLMPKTMKGKELLKRVFVGKLTPLPSELSDGAAVYTPPVEIPPAIPNKDYKVLFAAGSCR